jgi:hypothetical protein
MGEMIVRKAAAATGSFRELTQELAQQIPDADRRETFRRRCDRHRHETPAGETAPPSLECMATTTVDIEETPVVAPITPTWSEGLLARVERELVGRIGPIGALLLERAARRTTDLGELIGILEESVPDPTERKAFAEAVRALT